MTQLDYDRLVRVFATVLTPMLAGCSVEGIDEAQFSYDMCSEDGYTMLESVNPESAVDYLDLRRSYEPFTPGEHDTLDQTGIACEGASDPAACADALATLDPNSEFNVVGGGFELASVYQLAFTRGDEVDAVAARAALDSFLGSIDAPGDAAVMAMLSGHKLNCGAEAEVGDHDDGYVVFTTSGEGCGPGNDVEHHLVLVRADGTVQVLESELIEKGDPNCAIGRLPAGLCRRRVAPAANPVGRFLAEVASLEAAAVPAFGQLATELVVHRAPAGMVRGALRARGDEVRHARIMARLAHRHGGRPQAPTVLHTPPRSLIAVAQDNAVEGCVRETYGALVAHYQARRARTPALRRAFASIAQDETRHAALSWGLARWADAQLRPAARAQVARQRSRAVERLRVELTGALEPAVHRVTGLPAPAQARALFDGLARLGAA